MSVWTDLKRWWAGGPNSDGRMGAPRRPLAESPIARDLEDPPAAGHLDSAADPDAPPVAVLMQGPLTDLKRLERYLASVGIEAQLVMPPGGCGT